MKGKKKFIGFYFLFILAGIFLSGNFAEAANCECYSSTDVGGQIEVGSYDVSSKEECEKKCAPYNADYTPPTNPTPPTKTECELAGGTCYPFFAGSSTYSCPTTGNTQADNSKKCDSSSDVCCVKPTTTGSNTTGSTTTGSTTTGCCVNGSNCTGANVVSDCQSPAKFESKKCSEIEACSGSTTTGCCVGSPCVGVSKAEDCQPSTKFESKKCSEISACSSSGSGSSSGGSTGSSSTIFTNPIAYEKISEVLDALLNNLMGIIAFIAVIFIIIGGIMYMMAAGDETMITRAKKTWTGAAIGFAIALASPTFLKEIKKILGGGGTGGSAESWVDSALTIKEIAINVLELLLSIIGIVAIISLVIGGATYLTAYGDEKKLDSAKKIIKFSIIGITVALASLIIVKQIARLLGVSV